MSIQRRRLTCLKLKIRDCCGGWQILWAWRPGNDAEADLPKHAGFTTV